VISVKKIGTSILVFAFVMQSEAQTPAGSNQIPIDTTYTIWSTYKKLIKQYLDIKPVKESSSKNVNEWHDVIYATLPDTPFGVRELRADIFAPSRISKKIPAIILVHGGGWRSGNKAMNKPMAQRLAANGFVVISVEYRLSLEAKYPAAVHDIKSAIRWVRENAETYQIDDRYIAVAGASAGGQLATLIGATNDEQKFEGSEQVQKFSSEVQAVVDMDGLLDFTDSESLAVKRIENSADVFWLEGSYEAIPERWKEASAITWVSPNDPPFLFINSSQTRFHAGCATMVEKLKKNNIYNEVQALKGAPHSYWFFDPWFEPTIQHITTFLNKVFKLN
jgi:acetyl esterase/lipase